MDSGTGIVFFEFRGGGYRELVFPRKRKRTVFPLVGSVYLMAKKRIHISLKGRHRFYPTELVEISYQIGHLPSTVRGILSEGRYAVSYQVIKSYNPLDLIDDLTPVSNLNDLILTLLSLIVGKRVRIEKVEDLKELRPFRWKLEITPTLLYYGDSPILLPFYMLEGIFIRRDVFPFKGVVSLRKFGYYWGVVVSDLRFEDVYEHVKEYRLLLDIFDMLDIFERVKREEFEV